MRKVAVFVIIISLIFAIRSIVVSIYKLNEERARIERVAQGLQDKKKEQAFLREQLYYVQSNTFVEKEAREKLGMVKKNEYLVVAPQASSAGAVGEVQPSVEKPNWQKWWRLFF